MGIMVYSLLWVMQDLYYQPYCYQYQYHYHYHYHYHHYYRNLLKSCPVCLIACKPSGKGFLEVVPFKPLHGVSPIPHTDLNSTDVLCLTAFRWGLCCAGWNTQTFKRCVVCAFRWCFAGGRVGSSCAGSAQRQTYESYESGQNL